MTTTEKRFRHHRSSTRIYSFRLFFPAACIQAALVVPLSLAAVVTGSGWPPGLVAAGHGHELIFGFALALIAGYTLGPQPPRILYSLLALWFLARISYTLAPNSWLALLLNPGFALALAWFVVPRFRAAKKWRNRMLAPLLFTICLTPVVWSAVPSEGVLNPIALMHFSVLLLLMLMNFMSGRLIAPAAAGALQARGIELRARVQPETEATLLLTLASASVLVLMPATKPLAGLLLVGSAILILVRTLRWRLWLCSHRPDLLGLGLGSLWLATGAAITGAALIAGRAPGAALHLITVGALGTLSTGVMMRLHYQRAPRTAPPAPWVMGTTMLIAVSAIARYMAGNTPFGNLSWLCLAAAMWSLAFILTALLLLQPLQSRFQ